MATDEITDPREMSPEQQAEWFMTALSKKDEDKTVVNRISKTTVFHEFTHSYIHRADLERLAIDNWKSGITFRDVMKRFAIRKRHAQDTLNRANNVILFTDKRQRPQRYYPISKRAELIEYRNKALEATRVSPFTNTHDGLEEGKADNFLQALLTVKDVPQMIHKIQLHFWADKATWAAEEIYNTLAAIPRGDKAKVWNIRIGHGDICYTIHANGHVIIDIACSEIPFPLQNETDISALFAYLGRVHQTLLDRVLYDPHQRFTPSLMEWRLTRCDLNRDVPITEKAQLALPDIQLVYAERVLRMYVKAMGGDAFYRIEEAVTTNQAVHDAVDSFVIRNREVSTQT